MPKTPKFTVRRGENHRVSQASWAYTYLSPARDMFSVCIRYMYGLRYTQDACDTTTFSYRRRAKIGVLGIFAPPRQFIYPSLVVVQKSPTRIFDQLKQPCWLVNHCNVAGCVQHLQTIIYGISAVSCFINKHPFRSTTVLQNIKN